MILSGVPFVWALSNSMIIPVLPEIQRALELSSVKAGLLVTFLSVPTGLLLPLAGFLSDRLGRTRVMVPALLAYGVGGLLVALAAAYAPDPFPLMLAARALQGVGAAGTTLLAMALAADLSRGESRVRALGALEASNSVGKLVSPVMGSAAALVVWYGPFLVYPVAAVPLALLLSLTLREPPTEGAKRGTLMEYLSTLLTTMRSKGDSLAGTLLAGFAAIFLWFGTLFFLAEVLDERYRVGGTLRGLYLALPVLAMALAAALSGRHLAGLGLRAQAALGMACTGVAATLSILLGADFLVKAGVAFIGVGLGVTLPALNTMITSLVAEDRRGMVTALYGTVRSFGSAFGPPAFGLMVALGDIPLFAAMLALSFLALCSLLLLVREKGQGSAAPSEEVD